MELINKILQKKYLFILLSSVLPLAGALVSQYGFGLHPCELCIYQRIPYIVLIVFSVALFFCRKDEKLCRLLLILCVVAFLVDSGIAFYHVGVEKHWWEFGKCAGKFDMSSFESFKNSVMNAPNVKCSDVQFSFLGLSMAGWNFLYCLSISVFIIYRFLIRKA